MDPETLYKSSRAGLLHHVPTAAATTSAATTAVAAASTSTAPNLPPPLLDDGTEKTESSTASSATPATAARLPADMAYYRKQAEQSLHPNAALHQVLQFIYRDLDLVLNDPTLESREKMMRYRKLLNRLQFFIANPNNSNISSSYASSPPAHLRQSAEEASEALLQRLVNQVPQRNRSRTTTLYKKLEKSGLVKWNEDGVVREMSGRRIQPERHINIVELLSDAARYRKTVDRPAGYTPFTKALHDTDITDASIGNYLYKKTGPGRPLVTRRTARGRKRANSDEEEEADAEEEEEEEEEEVEGAAAAPVSSFRRRLDDQSSDDDDAEYQTPATLRASTSHSGAKSKKKRKGRNRATPYTPAPGFTPSRRRKWEKP